MGAPRPLPPLPSHPRVVGSVLDLVGDTPLFTIRSLDADAPRGLVLATTSNDGSLKIYDVINFGARWRRARCLAGPPPTTARQT